jgi:hypothetical protein
MGMFLIVNLQDAKAGSTYPYLTVLPYKEAGDIAVNAIPVQVFHLNGLEGVSVVNLQDTPHTQIEKTVLILYDTIHVVTGHAVPAAFFLFIDMELIAVISVQAIPGGRPYKTIVVEIYLIGEIA